MQKQYTQAEIEERISALEDIADLMDAKFTIPATSIGVGLDSIIGLIPGIGDTVSLGVSGWVVYQSYKLGVRKRTLTRMAFNIFVDWLIGLLPLIGDIFDIGWKANIRNVRLLRRSLVSRSSAASPEA